MNRQFNAGLPLLLILALVFASAVSSLFVIVRLAYSGQISYLFLVWNLFLAWLPFCFAIIVIMFPGKHYVTSVFATLWLLFFPNALYIVTDLLHLGPRFGIPLWYDMIMLMSFALTGLCLGFASLALMQRQVRARWGWPSSWLFTLSVLLLSGFGVYIGRFLRWNSWDVFSRPWLLWQDLFLIATTPALLLKAVAVTLALAAIFSFTYVVFTLLPQIATPAYQVSGD